MEKKKLDKNKMFKFAVMVYFMISPIFDIVYFYNHYTTLFRVCCLLLFVVITVILYKESRKEFLFLLAYYFALGGYLLVSYFHSKGFFSVVPNINFSLLQEAMTLLKLAMPFTILFVLKYQRLDKKDFFKIINCWIILVAGSIVLLNVSGLSLSSYTGEFTHYSIFSWRRGLDMRLTATKGLFAYTNQEVAILLMLLSLSIYEYLYMNKKSILLVFVVSLSLIMLGSRISTYGGLAVLFFVPLLYLGFCVVFKKKIEKKVVFLLPILLFWIIILPVSPNTFRVQEIENATKTKESRSSDESSNKDVLQEKLEYIDSHINKNLIGEQFYKDFYPYEYDTDFWLEIIELQGNTKLDYRIVETRIIRRVWELDNRKSNLFWGLSNSRIQSMMNIERDFVLHYYAFGIVGMIVVLGFYIYEIVNVGIKTLKNLHFVNLIIALCFCLFIISAFLSGNILNFMTTIVPCAYIVSSIGRYKDC